MNNKDLLESCGLVLMFFKCSVLPVARLPVTVAWLPVAMFVVARLPIRVAMGRFLTVTSPVAMVLSLVVMTPGVAIAILDKLPKCKPPVKLWSA